MIDNTTDTFRSLMEATFDIAPQTPELPQVSKRRLTTRPMLALASGFAAVLVFVGAGVALVAQGDQPPTYRSSATTTTHPVAVGPPPTPIGQIELVPSLGPGPQFDTSTLGEEVSPDRTNPAIALDDELLATLLDPDFPTANPIFYVGQLGGIYGFIISTPDVTGQQSFCLLRTSTLDSVVKSDTDVWACSNTRTGIVGSYGVSDRPDQPANLSPQPLEVIALTFDPDVSVIAIEHSAGVKQWQRAYGGTALFIVNGVDPSGSFTIAALGADGETLSTRTFNSSTGG